MPKAFHQRACIDSGRRLHSQNHAQTLQQLIQPDNQHQNCETEDGLATTLTLGGCCQQQLYQVCCISSSTPAVNRSILEA